MSHSDLLDNVNTAMLFTHISTLGHSALESYFNIQESNKKIMILYWLEYNNDTDTIRRERFFRKIVSENSDEEIIGESLDFLSNIPPLPYIAKLLETLKTKLKLLKDEKKSSDTQVKVKRSLWKRILTTTVLCGIMGFIVSVCYNKDIDDISKAILIVAFTLLMVITAIMNK